jgi:hypothetical protein
MQDSIVHGGSHATGPPSSLALMLPCSWRSSSLTRYWSEYKAWLLPSLVRVSCSDSNFPRLSSPARKPSVAVPRRQNFRQNGVIETASLWLILTADGAAMRSKVESHMEVVEKVVASRRGG